MTKLILIRHGRTLWNSSGKFQGQSDIELSQEGISQAEKLAENFPVTHIDKVYSSNLKRAYITGEIIAKNLMCQSSKINVFVKFLSALGKV